MTDRQQTLPGRRARRVQAPVATAGLWRVFAVRGVFGVLFGLTALLWPGATILALALLFGAYALLDGIAMLSGAARHGPGAPAGGLDTVLHVVGGLAGIGVAAMTAVWPDITAFVLVTLAGWWAVITGALHLAAAWRLRRLTGAAVLIGLVGAASVVAGILLIGSPIAGAFAIAIVLGLYGLVAGVFQLAFALWLRQTAA
jgi:uncharacterized membrane protein HdeD (DUF308 family)